MFAGIAIRAVLWLGLVLSAALAGSATFAVAAVPDGPRLAIIKSSLFPEDPTEIATVDAAGGALQTLVRDEEPRTVGILGSRPSFSQDGSLIAFAGSAVEEEESPLVSVVGVDGTGLRVLRHTFTEEEPIFAPDGHTIVFATLKVVSGQFQRRGNASGRYGVDVRFGIRSVDIRDGTQRMVTPWRRGLVLIPSSYSPDGSTLAVTARNFKGSTNAVAVRLDGSGSTLLAKNAAEPAYSPDGSRIAFVRVGTRVKHFSRHRTRRIARRDLYVMNVDGSGLARFTRNPGTLESWPSWDPSGGRIAFTSYRPAPIRKPFDIPQMKTNSVMQVNADGTCLTRVLSSRRQTFNGVAWQPGPGRGAGPIECGG